MNTDTGTPEKNETSLRVAFGMHSSSPDAWGWEMSSKDGYSWGTAPTERQALHDSLEQMQRVSLNQSAQSGPVIELSKVEQMAAYYEAPKGFFDWVDTMRHSTSS